MKKQLVKVLVLAACFLLAGCGEAKAVKTIKQSYFYGYENKTIGDAVDDFFANPKWEAGIPVDEEFAGKTLINCMGEITYDDIPVMAEIQFVLDEKTGEFELNAFEINGVPQNQYMQNVLLEAMFE